MLITFLAFVLTAQFKVVVLSPRYLIYISPLLLILAAIGVTTFNKKKTALFLAFWLFAGVFYLMSDKEIINYKNCSLYAPAQYIRAHGLTPSDLVIMPFGSSVIGHYLGGNSPKVLDFEAIQEFRNIGNSRIYSLEQQQLLKMLDKSRIFVDIVFPDTNISDNFTDYIRSALDSVPIDGKVLVILTGTDRMTVMNDKAYSDYFSNPQNSSNLMFSFLVEFNHTLSKLMAENFEVVSTESDNLQLYILLKRVK